MQGLILAAGTGSRLSPLTLHMNKHLLPVFDKPMIYYPLSTLILAGVNKIVIVTNRTDVKIFEQLLGTGDDFGIEIEYAPQDSALGIPNAIQCAGNYLDKNEPSLVILGDNIFYGAGLGRNLSRIFETNKAGIFSIKVPNPEEFGVIESDDNGKVLQIIEKPQKFISHDIVPGLYHLPANASEKIKKLQFSDRGELEISDLLNLYLNKEMLQINYLERGTVWFDCGTTSNLTNTSEFIKLTQERLGKLIGSPHEAAFVTERIDATKLEFIISNATKTTYWEKLHQIIV